MEAMSGPDLIFGGASFGSPIVGKNFCTPENVQELLDQLKLHNVDRIDTAARYSPGNPGGSETLLGQLDAGKQGFTIDTKINIPDANIATGAGSLSATAISKSIDESFSRLNVESVHILHFHRSDPVTPVEEQAAEMHKQYMAGRFEKFGVSNFTPQELAELISVCEREGYIKPSVYQGCYNAIDRQPEETLFPLLREHGIVFNAYRPLAGGFLSGRATRGDVENSRFSPGNPVSKMLNDEYDKPNLHAAMTELLQALEPHNISGSEACLRWIFYHSALGYGDGVILGASRTSQAVQNLQDISRGPLPAEIVEKIDMIWKLQ
ncbi:hypothetical protein N7456_005557 [Penicillium angulare]|uniref:NADP-dependent oxidoreductase domain-containing protein n=1 Tax=Penicillium angulare TaxID=116970 RepID=A0A9W9FYR4_9EURO|nr:hypothetical protein N7456_005557 [Penicillium angulare]